MTMTKKTAMNSIRMLKSSYVRCAENKVGRRALMRVEEGRGADILILKINAFICLKIWQN